jgi:hypothetical protein
MVPILRKQPHDMSQLLVAVGRRNVGVVAVGPVEAIFALEDIDNNLGSLLIEDAQIFNVAVSQNGRSRCSRKKGGKQNT